MLLKLGEACRELSAIDRMFVFNKMAVHWGISPKKISRRLSRLRATSDKQPVKNSLSRLNALLVAEPKEELSNENAAALSPKFRELLAAPPSSASCRASCRPSPPPPPLSPPPAAVHAWWVGGRRIGRRGARGGGFRLPTMKIALGDTRARSALAPALALSGSAGGSAGGGDGWRCFAGRGKDGEDGEVAADGRGRPTANVDGTAASELLSEREL
ncbi:hypothetical protein R5R35_011652 [Gryllus longicercus]|uniref:Uncharacterized protein n=1 Tax=Gryllus longicercus TaxID=2509291 RepID=A0AAN9VFW0_9ORTH